MAYTNTWDDALPLDGSDADLIGADIRQLRVDVHERFNSLIGAAINTALADPIVPSNHTLADYRTELDAVAPLLATQTYDLYIGGLDCQWDTAMPVNNITKASFVNNQSTWGSLVHVLYPIRLPVGAHVTGISTSYSISAGGTTFTANVYDEVMATGISTDLGAALPSVVGLNTTAWTGLTPFTIVAGHSYSLLFICNPATATSQSIHGHRITYTSANANVRF